MPNTDLHASVKYRNLSQEHVDKVSNGCGYTGKVKLLNWIMGIKIKEACDIHDVEYFYRTMPRGRADLLFKKNLYLLIEKSNTKGMRQWAAKRIADAYYFAVVLFGGITV